MSGLPRIEQRPPKEDKPLKRGQKLPKAKYDAIRYHKKKGLDNREIAEKVQVSISTVQKVTSGPKFKKSLRKYRLELGIQRLNNAGSSAEAAAEALVYLRQHPEKLTARDVKDLGTFSNNQYESGSFMLAKEIAAMEDEGDPEYQKAKEFLEKKRQATVVNPGTEVAVAPKEPDESL